MNKVEYVKKLREKTSVKHVFANADDSITIVVDNICRCRKTDFCEPSLKVDGDAINKIVQEAKEKKIQEKLDEIEEDFK
ncbi:MAG: hypothetical protein II850_03825 [Fibrobacter sp.]|jgi:hypothetical protein|nr:hypothetical protein [Fibrobacter sp.]